MRGNGERLTENVIELVNTSFRYAGSERFALQNVSLSIKRGEIAAIVGHNGSGKSTLAKLLNALLLPSDGSVRVCGMDTQNEADTLEIRRRVGMVFQNPDNQLVTSVVEEDVGFGPENLGLPPAEIRKRVDAALDTVHMTAYAKKAGYALSGGQKQRVAIAGMLAMRPEVLVLDEATAMLDPRGRDEVLFTARRLNGESGMTIVMITQYMEEAALADRVFVLNDGALRMEGTPAEVFREAALLRENGLDAPAYPLLRDALIDIGMPLSSDVMDGDALAGQICAAFSQRKSNGKDGAETHAD